MTLAFPTLLMIIGFLSFWIIVGSKAAWQLKIMAISAYFSFVVIFFYSIHSLLGWSSPDMPEEVAIHSVVIKEPNPFQKSKGRIYLTLEASHGKYENKFLHMFEYESERDEPRLYSLPYSRQLHEEMERSVMPRTKEGQKVYGKFKKGKGAGEGGEGGDGEGDGKGGKGKGKSGGKGGKGNGGGSESQEQEFHFYELPPAEIQRK